MARRHRRVGLQDEDLTVLGDEHSLAAALLARVAAFFLTNSDLVRLVLSVAGRVDGGARASAPGRTRARRKHRVG